jgi:hypothetical protein
LSIDNSMYAITSGYQQRVENSRHNLPQAWEMPL